MESAMEEGDGGDLLDTPSDPVISNNSVTLNDSLSVPGLTNSPPGASTGNVVVDTSTLIGTQHAAMDRNKESLKVKLSTRRPITTLIEQGILPPSSAPAAYSGQRVKLERARMSDLLKAKIQRRPGRQELIRQHILEDTPTRVAPSLAEAQRMLKRARLADSLSDHLLHRPGPLELVKKNILVLPSVPDLGQALQEGVVEFRATSEAPPKPNVPHHYEINISEDESSSSDLSDPAAAPGATLDPVGSPADTEPATPAPVGTPAPVTPVAVSICLTTSVTPPLTTAQLTISPSPGLRNSGPCLVPLSNSATSGQVTSDPQPRLAFVPAPTKSARKKGSGSGGSSSSKSKSSSSSTSTQPKTRTIKFHEYKGPPSAIKSSQSGSSSSTQASASSQESETSYGLLLQQQQLFLQWQLECRNKQMPHSILISAGVGGGSHLAGVSQSVPTTQVQAIAPAPAPQQQQILIAPAPPPPRTIAPQIAAPAVIQQAAGSAPLQSSPLPSMSVQSAMSSYQQSAPAVLLPAPITTSTDQSPLQSEPPGIATPPIRVATLVEKYNRNSIGPEIVKSITGTPVSTVPYPQPTTIASLAPPTSPGTPIPSKKPLTDWKVPDLRAELKRRNLPVSGPKMQLIERLQKVVGNSSITPTPATSESSSSNEPMDFATQQQSSGQMHFSLGQNGNCSTENEHSNKMNGGQGQPNSEVVKIGSIGKKTMDIKPVKEVNKLLGSQSSTEQSKSNSKPNLVNSTEPGQSKPNNRLYLQLHVQQRMAAQAQAQAQLNAAKKLKELVQVEPEKMADNNTITLHKSTEEDPTRPPSGHVREYRNYFESFATMGDGSSSPGVTATAALSNGTSRKPVGALIPVKSQMVDDVLEILIRNGELPPSAANDPSSSSSMHQQQTTQPGFSNSTTSSALSDVKSVPTPPPPPPPPPPLPPSTFSVTLPTSITFPRGISIAGHSGHVHVPQPGVIGLSASHSGIGLDHISSTSSLGIDTSPAGGLPCTAPLSPTAQHSILRISQDLFNFATAHDSAVHQAALHDTGVHQTGIHDSVNDASIENLLKSFNGEDCPGVSSSGGVELKLEPVHSHPPLSPTPEPMDELDYSNYNLGGPIGSCTGGTDTEMVEDIELMDYSDWFDGLTLPMTLPQQAPHPNEPNNNTDYNSLFMDDLNSSSTINDNHYDPLLCSRSIGSLLLTSNSVPSGSSDDLLKSSQRSPSPMNCLSSEPSIWDFV